MKKSIVSEEGFSVIEVLIAVAIIGTFISGMGVFAGRGVAQVKQAEERMLGYRILDRMADQLQSLPSGSGQLANGAAFEMKFDARGNEIPPESTDAHFTSQVNVTEETLTTGVLGAPIKRKKVDIVVSWENQAAMSRVENTRVTIWR